MKNMKLTDIPDKSLVTVVNKSWGCDDSVTSDLQLNGRLELPCDEGESYYVRCPELGGELNGVSFEPKHVKEIELLPSGRIAIVLKF